MAILVRETIRNYYLVDLDTKLDIDYAIKSLCEQEELSDFDLLIIEYSKLQYTPAEIGLKLRCSMTIVGRRFNQSCSKIAKFLGISYSDIKILMRVEKRLGRSLTVDERIFCWFMINRYGFRTNNKLNIHNFIIGRDGKVRVPDE